MLIYNLVDKAKQLLSPRLAAVLILCQLLPTLLPTFKLGVNMIDNL